MRHRTAVLALCPLLLAGCITESPQMSSRPAPAAPVATAMDGSWASTDGIFVASFGGGKFTSRFTKTNEILAQGRYSVAGSKVRMDWISVQAQQERSADCTVVGPDSVRCAQPGGGGFELRRA